jgi:hypothetical protein
LVFKKNDSLDGIIEGNMVEPIVGNVHEGVGGAAEKTQELVLFN